MQLGDVLVAGGLDDADDAHRRQVGSGERAVVDDLLDRRAGRRDDLGEAREAAGPVGDRHGEARQAAVGDEPDLDDAVEHREVDVAAAQHEHDVACP